MHLVDHGRHHIEDTYTRALADRLLRRLLGVLMPRPDCSAGYRCWAGSPSHWRRRCPHSRDPGGATFLRRIKAMVDAIPAVDSRPLAGRPAADLPGAGRESERVALMPGCGQQVLAPEVNEATVRLLTRHGVEVVNVAGSGCCGSSVQHIGDNEAGARAGPAQHRCLAQPGVRRHRDQRLGLRHDGQGLRPYVRRRSGLEDKAERVSRLAKDVSELMMEVGLANVTARRSPLPIIRHVPCSTARR